VFEGTTDRVYDSEVARRMVDRSMGAGNVIKVIGDGTYDSIRLIRYLPPPGSRDGWTQSIRSRRSYKHAIERHNNVENWAPA
jgi:hypothetical protein